ncbi:MAG: hypothetical protein WC645_01800 [Candidatus Margulisiibacteriota bacterium]
MMNEEGPNDEGIKKDEGPNVEGMNNDSINSTIMELGIPSSLRNSSFGFFLSPEIFLNNCRYTYDWAGRDMLSGTHHNDP